MSESKTPFSLNWIKCIKYEALIKDRNPIINLVPIGKYKTGRDRYLWIAKFPDGTTDKRFAMFCKNVCYISINQFIKRKYKIEDVVDDNIEQNKIGVVGE